MTLEHYRSEQRRRGNPVAVEIAEVLLRLFGEVPLPAFPEGQTEIRRFTDKEKRVLREDGASIYGLTGQTICEQREIRKGKISFWSIEKGLIQRPSLCSEVAIYPDPERFFIPNSGGIIIEGQEKLAEKDAKMLRKSLGLTEIDVIIPEAAATLAELTFRHLDKTGTWLFGREYASVYRLSWIFGGTKNPTDKFGSHVAGVGATTPATGVVVMGWDRSLGNDCVRAVRLVVPKGDR